MISGIKRHVLICIKHHKSVDSRLGLFSKSATSLDPVTLTSVVGGTFATVTK